MITLWLPQYDENARGNDDDDDWIALSNVWSKINEEEKVFSFKLLGRFFLLQFSEMLLKRAV